MRLEPLIIGLCLTLSANLPVSFVGPVAAAPLPEDADAPIARPCPELADNWDNPFDVSSLAEEQFAPRDEDRAPLQPGEEEALFRFVRQNMPTVHQRMRMMRQRDPEGFERRLQRFAPRIRQLKRIYDQNPDLARAIVTHAHNLQMMKRAVRLWRAGAPGPRQRDRLRAELRERIERNLRLEAGALERRLQQRRATRDVAIDSEVAWLSRPDANVEREPTPIRAAVEAVRDAATPEEINAAQSTLRASVARRVDARTDRLARQIACMRDHADDIIEARLRRLLSLHEEDDDLPQLGGDRPLARPQYPDDQPDDDAP